MEEFNFTEIVQGPEIDSLNTFAGTLEQEFFLSLSDTEGGITQGTESADILEATPGLETETQLILGFCGNDQITVGSDDSTSVIAGAGDDLVSSGSDRDLLLGGEGQDNLSGGGGRDIIQGGSGNDEISGGTDNDRLFGDAPDGSVFVLEQTRADLIRGGDGNDIIISGFGNDTLFGMMAMIALQGLLTLLLKVQQVTI